MVLFSFFHSFLARLCDINLVPGFLENTCKSSQDRFIIIYHKNGFSFIQHNAPLDLAKSISWLPQLLIRKLLLPVVSLHLLLNNALKILFANTCLGNVIAHFLANTVMVLYLD